MERKVPWWMPRTRAMRGVCLLAALAFTATGAWFTAVTVHSLTQFGRAGPVLFTAGLAAGALLCLAVWPGDRR